MVERSQLWLSQALHHSQYGRIDEADAQVGVSGEQGAHTCVVDGLQLVNKERLTLTVLQKPHERVDLTRATHHVLDLHEDGCRHNPILAALLEQPRARDVIVVAGLDGGENYSGVEDERQESGS